VRESRGGTEKGMSDSLNLIPHVVIVVIRVQDLFWIHQRATSKRIYPNLWGVGIGGKVDPGETADHAAKRELLEESGLDVSPVFYFDFAWRSPNVNYDGHLYVINIDNQQKESMLPCAREFQQHQWTTLAGIEAIKKSGHLCPDTEHFWNLFCAS